MLPAILFICTLISLVVCADPPPGGYYTTRYDHVDIENILNQKRLVHYYASCLLDRGPCTPQGTEFKNILPEAIKTNCLRCTEKQRVVTTRSVRRLRKEYPDIWAQLQERWDPTGENVKKLLSSSNKPIPGISPIPAVLPVSAASSIPAAPIPAISSIPSVSPLAVFDRFDDISSQNTILNTEGSQKIATIPNAFDGSTTIRILSTIASTLNPPTRTIGIRSGVSSTNSPTIIRSSTFSTTIAPATTRKILNSIIGSTIIYRPIETSQPVRPFNSIGPNLILPNPKNILDKVLMTASAVINSVTNTVSGVLMGTSIK